MNIELKQLEKHKVDSIFGGLHRGLRERVFGQRGEPVMVSDDGEEADQTSECSSLFLPLQSEPLTILTIIGGTRQKVYQTDSNDDRAQILDPQGMPNKSEIISGHYQCLVSFC
jgi:hypothetical protein